MPIFPRRVIQKIIDENRSFLPEDQVREHVNKLNAKRNASLATEWEIVILNVLSKIGNVQHEKKFNGERKPDIYFEASTIEPFVADITAISDDYYDKKNPIAFFYENVNKVFHAKGLTTRGLGIEVGSKNIGIYGDKRIHLSLPEKKYIPRFVKQEFSSIIDSIKGNPSQAFKTKIEDGVVSMTVTYNPQDKYFSGHYASYSVPYSLDNNPISRRLQKKANQLRKSGYLGVMGVFICDASCDSLNHDMRSVEQYTQDQIIHKAFIDNTSLSFVVIITPEEQHQAFGIRAKKYIKGKFYSNTNAKYPVSNQFFSHLKIIEKHFPIPQTMPINVKRNPSNKDEGHSHYGGFTMSDNKIKISSRMITELFAGVLDFGKFDKDQKSMNTDKKNYIREFFLRQLMNGKMIKDISVEKCSDEDDDWVEFVYGHSDPAISKFK